MQVGVANLIQNYNFEFEFAGIPFLITLFALLKNFFYLLPFLYLLLFFICCSSYFFLQFLLLSLSSCFCFQGFLLEKDFSIYLGEINKDDGMAIENNPLKIVGEKPSMATWRRIVNGLLLVVAAAVV